MDYVIQQGTLCLEGEHFQADLTIRNGMIWAIGQTVHTGSEQVIDGRGKYVCPGGIDAHTHMDLQQSPQYRACDTFYTGGIAAACGGTTTILDHMAFGPKGCSLRAPFETYKKLAADCPVDYSFHGVLQQVDEAVLQELGRLIDEGFPSFKAYTTYGYPMTEPQLMAVFPVIKAHQGLLTVHAENDGMTNYLRDHLPADAVVPAGQAVTRPNMAEASSVSMVLATARICGDAPVYIVHVSAHESLEQVRLARRLGQENIFIETCPHYLLLTEEKFRSGGPLEGIKYMMAPPLRQAVDNEALWQGLRDGSIQVVATDHCPFTIAEKQEHVADFRTCPGGVSGVEERMPLLFSEGVLNGRISLERFVQVTSANAAKVFGIYPHKGTLQPGSDADIVLIDPQRQRTFAAENLHTACGYSPYEGMTTDCVIDTVWLRGQIIARNNEFTGERGYGRLLHRYGRAPYEEIVNA
ncbi:MAG: dihydropyrimidinase [Megasphaera sp.]|jgi:dihydropyrimidinase|nr:dihydropyrimidinase [Megasphaera sp.]MCH4187333.1 dihydropyrimidinase [Megasphaera sp.]MCH4217515.1 dihydropyrimidinase [Megasphaera sp.]